MESDLSTGRLHQNVRILKMIPYRNLDKQSIL